MKIAKIVVKEVPLRLTVNEIQLLNQEALDLNKRVAEICDIVAAGQIKKEFKFVEEHDLETGFISVFYGGSENPLEVRPMTVDEINEAKQELLRRQEEELRSATPTHQPESTPDPEPLPDKLDYHLTENLDPEFDPDDLSLA